MALAGRPDPRVRPPYCQVWVSAASDSSLSTSRFRDLDPFRGEQEALHAAGGCMHVPRSRRPGTRRVALTLLQSVSSSHPPGL